jgi:hypothetical protein
LIEQKMREVTRHNIVRRDSFAARLEDLMIRYMKQHPLEPLFVLTGSDIVGPTQRTTRREREESLAPSIRHNLASRAQS